ncbi:RDD family protein [Pinirhizobacter soli]|uniref:RDD family protein n=1 Tax=Pinirhizobacter soli TaxID=2786953 RepID=UPI00202AC1FF|nr:RDD family protein [Pinirhizobacter soli]
MIYSTFWRRVGAQLLDVVVLLPVLALHIALGGLGREAYVVSIVLLLLFNLGYHVYLVTRFGGTPGKLLVGLRIVRVNGLPVSYQQALLRYIVYLFLSICSFLALVVAALTITDADYASLDWRHRNVSLLALSPSWYSWVIGLTRLWGLGLLIVMLTNSERRTIHDFIAGTVVVRKAQSPDVADVAPEPPALPAD